MVAKPWIVLLPVGEATTLCDMAHGDLPSMPMRFQPASKRSVARLPIASECVQIPAPVRVRKFELTGDAVASIAFALFQSGLHVHDFKRPHFNLL